MTETQLKRLRMAIAAYVIFVGVLWCFSFRQAILQIEDTGLLSRISGLTNSTYYLAVWLLSFVIIIRARLNLGNLLFALLMAANSLAPIIDIAFETGWDSLGTFGRTFQDIADESPTELRMRERTAKHDLQSVPHCYVSAAHRPDLKIAVSEKRRLAKAGKDKSKKGNLS